MRTVRTIVGAVGVLLLLLAARSGVSAADLDADTLKGMDAEVRKDWAEAVTCFGRAAAAAPEDKTRQKRLECARKRGGAYWRSLANTLLENQVPSGAATAAALARDCDPGHRELRSLVKRVEDAGASVPDRAPDLAPAHPVFPGRSAMSRLLIYGRLGADGLRAEENVEAAIAFLVGAQKQGGDWESPLNQGYPLPAYPLDATGYNM